MMIAAALATFPERIGSLEQTIASLWSQVDRLYVWLNGYTEVPGLLRDMNPEKLVIGHGDDLGDLGKLQWVQAEAIYLACDDDIVYPPDYAARMRAAVASKPRAIWGVMGARYREPIQSYYRDRVPKIGLSAGLREPAQVHMVGTGTAAFDTRSVRIDPSRFTIPNMADVWLSVWARRHRVPMWCVDRPAGWLHPLSIPGFQIYGHYLRTREDQVQTQMVREASPWPELPALHVRNGVIRQERANPLLGAAELSLEVFDFLRARIDPGRPIVELGSGRGTAALCDLAPVVTLEHSAHWAKRCTRRARCYLAPLAGNPPWYRVAEVQSALAAAAGYQCVIVDGPPSRVGRSGILSHMDLFDNVPFVVDGVHRPDEARLARAIGRRLGRPVRLHEAGHGRLFATIGWS